MVKKHEFSVGWVVNKALILRSTTGRHICLFISLTGNYSYKVGQKNQWKARRYRNFYWLIHWKLGSFLHLALFPPFSIKITNKDLPTFDNNIKRSEKIPSRHCLIKMAAFTLVFHTRISMICNVRLLKVPAWIAPTCTGQDLVCGTRWGSKN